MYPPEIKDIIAVELETENLSRICAREGMPSRRAVNEWLRQDEEFRTRCARARELHADLEYDGIREIEDDVLADVVKPDAARVVISSRQWRLAKALPKKYGDKIETTHEAGESIRAIVREIVRP